MVDAHALADDALYRHLFPYYAELTALTEIKKKPGFGVTLNSGIGGHSLLYLHGVRRDRNAGYPVLKLCDADDNSDQGVGLSVNAHYRNANWVAAEGPDFLWRGILKPGESVSREAYHQTQEAAKSLGILDGIEFHEYFFADQPPGMSVRDYMYELSIATDYAAQFGRDIYRARVPLDRARMGIIIAYLNALNAPYREGKKIFYWKVMNNNCAHMAHNALAEAGIWAPWPTGQFVGFAAFKFPVPKNEFVDLVLRTNDLPITEPARLERDVAARRALLTMGILPSAPGAVARFESAISTSDVYDVKNLRVIFFDNPFWGPYRGRMRRILSEPRYYDLDANFKHFEMLYASAQERLDNQTGGQNEFHAQYRLCIEREAGKLRALQTKLDHFGKTAQEILT